MAILVALSGCLPRGPISLNWPWRRSAEDCPDCDDGMSVCAPHSMFHPVPTRPVFTPWLCDAPVEAAPGTVATRQPDEKSFDKPERLPSDSEFADRRPTVRSASAHSNSSDGSQRSAASSSPAQEYYNPAAESADGNAPATNGSSVGQQRASNSGS